MADIARRVRSACAGMGEEELAALVGRMADVELRYRERAHTPPLGVSATGRATSRPSD